MKKGIKALAWGLAGLTLTAALSLGAFAVAGSRLSSPSTSIKMLVPPLAPDTARSSDASRSPRPSRSPHNDAPSRPPTTSHTVAPPVPSSAPGGTAPPPPQHEPGGDHAGDGKPSGDS